MTSMTSMTSRLDVPHYFRRVTMNPNLFEAKREYSKQLANILTPYVFATIAKIFEANRHKFRQALRDVPNWNSGMIGDKTTEITMKHPHLQNLITAACVSYTKMLGSIRLNNNASSNVRVTIPEVGPFIHSVYTYVAREFFYEPTTLLKANRHVKNDLVEDAIDEAVREHVPIDQLLDAYLSPAVDTRGIDPFAASFDPQLDDDGHGGGHDGGYDGHGGGHDGGYDGHGGGHDGHGGGHDDMHNGGLHDTDDGEQHDAADNTDDYGIHERDVPPDPVMQIPINRNLSTTQMLNQPQPPQQQPTVQFPPNAPPTAFPAQTMSPAMSPHPDLLPMPQQGFAEGGGFANVAHQQPQQPQQPMFFDDTEFH